VYLKTYCVIEYWFAIVRLIRIFHVSSVCPMGSVRADYYGYSCLQSILIVCTSKKMLAWMHHYVAVYEYLLMYADDIVLLAPSISALQDLLHICEVELAWLDMSLNTSKSIGMRIGPRHKHKCCELTTMDRHEILWLDTSVYI